MSTSVAAETIGIVKDIVLTVAAFIGMIVAMIGLNTWNRQLKGGVEYELTRRLLRCTYRLREAIKDVRHPMIMPSEQAFSDTGRALSMEEKRYFGIYHAYQTRWEKVTAARDDLQTELLEAEVIWSKAIYENFEPLFALQKELFADVQSYLALSDPNAGEQAKDTWHKIRNARRQVLYDLEVSGQDEYSTDVANAISGIESYLKPHLAK
jgi:hypothetical protein